MKHQMTTIESIALNDEVVEGNHKSCIYPNSVPLMSSKEKLKYRIVRATLQYHKPNPEKHSE